MPLIVSSSMCRTSRRCSRPRARGWWQPGLVPSEPVWPVFLIDGRDVDASATFDDVLRRWEPFLANDSRIDFIDASGQRVQLLVDRAAMNVLHVESTGAPAAPERLRTLLTAF